MRVIARRDRWKAYRESVDGVEVRQVPLDPLPHQHPRRASWRLGVLLQLRLQDFRIGHRKQNDLGIRNVAAVIAELPASSVALHDEADEDAAVPPHYCVVGAVVDEADPTRPVRVVCKVLGNTKTQNTQQTRSI